MNPSVTCGDSSAQGTPCGCPKGEPECKRAAPLGKGDQRIWWRGSLWNLLRNVRGYTEESLSQPAAASSLFKGAYVQISRPFRGGEPANLVEGFFVESFA